MIELEFPGYMHNYTVCHKTYKFLLKISVQQCVDKKLYPAICCVGNNNILNFSFFFYRTGLTKKSKCWVVSIRTLDGRVITSKVVYSYNTPETCAEFGTGITYWIKLWKKTNVQAHVHIKLYTAKKIQDLKMLIYSKS